MKGCCRTSRTCSPLWRIWLLSRHGGPQTRVRKGHNPGTGGTCRGRNPFGSIVLSSPTQSRARPGLVRHCRVQYSPAARGVAKNAESTNTGRRIESILQTNSKPKSMLHVSFCTFYSTILIRAYTRCIIRRQSQQVPPKAVRIQIVS